MFAESSPRATIHQGSSRVFLICVTLTIFLQGPLHRGFSKDHPLPGALDPKLSEDHSFTGVLVGLLAGALNPKLSKDHSFTGVLVGALNP